MSFVKEETPTDTSTDLISRQYVLYAIDYIEADEGLGMVDLREIVESLPSAEPKTGEWLYKESDHGKCSECGAWVYELSPFCPNCGADMGGEKSDD